ncbi:MAG: WhiB family transcriptional regulator [Acidimicrobiia bacterium]
MALTMVEELRQAVNQSWRQQARCRGVDSSMFFPSIEDDEALTAAKEICIPCPVRHLCLEYALATREKLGIWGGADERERRRILRQRRKSA